MLIAGCLQAHTLCPQVPEGRFAEPLDKKVSVTIGDAPFFGILKTSYALDLQRDFEFVCESK